MASNRRPDPVIHGLRNGVLLSLLLWAVIGGVAWWAMK